MIIGSKYRWRKGCNYNFFDFLRIKRISKTHKKVCSLTELVLKIWVSLYVLHNPFSSLRTWQGRKFDAELRFIRSPYQTYLAFNGGSNTRPANTEWRLTLRHTLAGQHFKHVWHIEHKIALKILTLSPSVKDGTTCQPEGKTGF